MDINLCIIYPNKSSSSETFIQAHVQKIPFNNKVLYGGWFPTTDGNGKPLKDYINFSAVQKIKFAIKPRTEFYLKERALADYLAANKIDVVMVEYGLTGTRVMNVCEREGIPLIVHFHGFDVYSKSVIAENLPAYKKMFVKAAAMIAVSTEMKEELIKLGAPAEKIVYNSCGVDVNSFLPAKEKVREPIFIFAGRFVNKKAPQLIIMAFHKVLEKLPNAKLVMVGDGGLGSAGELFFACQQIVKAFKLEKSVEFKGALSNEEVADEMRKALVFVQHSVRPENGDSEGTPVTLLEASASELAIIATRHGGIKDVVVDGKTGLMIDEYDIEGTTDRMIELASNVDYAIQLGKAARIWVSEMFSMERSIGKLAEVIERVVKEKKKI